MVGKTNVGSSGKLFAVIAVTYPEGSICTCSDGTKTMKAKDTSGKALFNVKAGTYTVECHTSDNSKSKSISVTVTESDAGKYIPITLVYEYVLFDNGTTDDAVGGWDITTAPDSSYFNVGVNSNIYLVSKSNTGNGAAIFSNNKVSMDGYSKLCFSYKVTSLGNEYNRFGLTNTIAGVKGLDIAAVYDVTSTDSNFRTAEISISNLQSSYHLYFGVRFYGNLYVNRVWLE